MAHPHEVRGAHERVPLPEGQVEALGSVSTVAEVTTRRRSVYGRAPLKTEWREVTYPDGKIKILRMDTFDLAKKGSAEPELVVKRNVACIFKGDRVLQGKWPEHMKGQMPAALRARMARAAALATA